MFTSVRLPLYHDHSVHQCVISSIRSHVYVHQCPCTFNIVFTNIRSSVCVPLNVFNRVCVRYSPVYVHQYKITSVWSPVHVHQYNVTSVSWPVYHDQYVLLSLTPDLHVVRACVHAGDPAQLCDSGDVPTLRRRHLPDGLVPHLTGECVYLC